MIDGNILCLKFESEQGRLNLGTAKTYSKLDGRLASYFRFQAVENDSQRLGYEFVTGLKRSLTFSQLGKQSWALELGRSESHTRSLTILHAQLSQTELALVEKISSATKSKSSH